MGVPGASAASSRLTSLERRITFPSHPHDQRHALAPGPAARRSAASVVAEARPHVADDPDHDERASRVLDIDAPSGSRSENSIFAAASEMTATSTRLRTSRASSSRPRRSGIRAPRSIPAGRDTGPRRSTLAADPDPFVSRASSQWYRRDRTRRDDVASTRERVDGPHVELLSSGAPQSADGGTDNLATLSDEKPRGTRSTSISARAVTAAPNTSNTAIATCAATIDGRTRRVRCPTAAGAAVVRRHAWPSTREWPRPAARRSRQAPRRSRARADRRQPVRGRTRPAGPVAAADRTTSRSRPAPSRHRRGREATLRTRARVSGDLAWRRVRAEYRFRVRLARAREEHVREIDTAKEKHQRRRRQQQRHDRPPGRIQHRPDVFEIQHAATRLARHERPDQRVDFSLRAGRGSLQANDGSDATSGFSLRRGSSPWSPPPPVQSREDELTGEHADDVERGDADRQWPPDDLLASTERVCQFPYVNTAARPTSRGPRRQEPAARRARAEQIEIVCRDARDRHIGRSDRIGVDERSPRPTRPTSLRPL